MINTRQVIITITEATCGRCGHVWELKRTDADGNVLIPKACPVCHSPYWNKPRKYHVTAMDADAEDLPPLDDAEDSSSSLKLPSSPANLPGVTPSTATEGRLNPVEMLNRLSAARAARDRKPHNQE